MAREITNGRGSDYWGFWLDADETIEIDNKVFDKNKNGTLETIEFNEFLSKLGVFLAT